VRFLKDNQPYTLKEVKMKDTFIELLEIFMEEDLLDNRHEHDIKDLMSVYPILTESEAMKLKEMIQEVMYGIYT